MAHCTPTMAAAASHCDAKMPRLRYRHRMPRTRLPAPEDVAETSAAVIDGDHGGLASVGGPLRLAASHGCPSLSYHGTSQRECNQMPSGRPGHFHQPVAPSAPQWSHRYPVPPFKSAGFRKRKLGMRGRHRGAHLAHSPVQAQHPQHPQHRLLLLRNFCCACRECCPHHPQYFQPFQRCCAGRGAVAFAILGIRNIFLEWLFAEVALVALVADLAAMRGR